MAKQVQITGIDRVLSNLNKQVSGIKSRTRTGMHAVAMLVKGTALPLTPIELGNLRGSWYSDVKTQGDLIGVEVGYGASYAVFVHERTELHHASPTQAKFLEEALKRKTKQILQILARSAKL